MSNWNEELPRFKDKRRDTENTRAVSNAKRQPRKWKVVGSFAGREYIAHRSATKEAAEAWIEKQARSYFVGRRNAPESLIDAAKERAEKRASRYRIEPPNAMYPVKPG